MDISTYLHTQFESYPRMFRDVSAYLSKEQVREAIMLSPQEFHCSACNDGKAKLTIETTKRGLGYHYKCAHCGLSSGGSQRHPAIAFWQWQAKKQVQSALTPAIVKLDMYDARCAKWERIPRAKSLMLSADWVAALKWVKLMWSKHRSTEDFLQLNEGDQLYVDAIGGCIAVLQKQAKTMASKLGLDVTDPESAFLLAQADVRIQEDRAHYYPYFQSRLSPVFRFKIKEALGINVQ